MRHSGAYVNSAYAIASHTVVNASKILLPETPQFWLGCSMSESVGLNRFALKRARILYSVFSQVIGLESAGVEGMSVLGMHTKMPCFNASIIRKSKYIWLNTAGMLWHMPFLPGAFLHALLLMEAICFTSEIGWSWKSLHSRRKVLCPASSIRETQASSTRICSYLLRRDSWKVCRILLTLVCTTRSLSIALVFIRETRRFFISKRWKWDWPSPWKGVNLCISMVVDWTRLLCSPRVLALCS